MKWLLVLICASAAFDWLYPLQTGPVSLGIAPAVALAGSAVFRGIKNWLGGKARRAQAKAQAENQRRLGQHRVDTGKSQLGRRGSLLGSLMRQLAEHPDLYKNVKADMFGYLPGPLTRESFDLPAYPTLEAPRGGGVGDFIGGLIEGGGDYLNRTPAIPGVSPRRSVDLREFGSYTPPDGRNPMIDLD